MRHVLANPARFRIHVQSPSILIESGVPPLLAGVELCQQEVIQGILRQGPTRRDMDFFCPLEIAHGFIKGRKPRVGLRRQGVILDRLLQDALREVWLFVLQMKRGKYQTGFEMRGVDSKGQMNLLKGGNPISPKQMDLSLKEVPFRTIGSLACYSQCCLGSEVQISSKEMNFSQSNAGLHHVWRILGGQSQLPKRLVRRPGFQRDEAHQKVGLARCTIQLKGIPELDPCFAELPLIQERLSSFQIGLHPGFLSMERQEVQKRQRKTSRSGTQDDPRENPVLSLLDHGFGVSTWEPHWTNSPC